MKNATIYLGSKCNLNCSYCHKEISENESSITDEFISYLKAHSELKRVSFIGGEPTLYFNEIKKVVDSLPSTMKYKITTNGINIKKYIDYFYEHKFLICISYDGSDINLRRYDPFKEIIDYPWLAVSCTLFHGNTDFKKIIKNFAEKEKIIGRTLFFFPHIIHYTSEYNKEYALTKEDYDYIFQQYKECVTEYIQDYVKYGIENIRYRGLFNQLENSYYAHYDFGETYCTNIRTRKFDCKGIDYSCLYIRDERSNELSKVIENKFPYCKICNVYNMCGAGCVKELNHTLECYYHKKLYTWFREYFKQYEEIMK